MQLTCPTKTPSLTCSAGSDLPGLCPICNNLMNSICSHFKALCWLQEKGIHLGDLVVVVRANDVIPKIETVVPHQQRTPGAQPWRPPAHCPACSQPLAWEGRDLLCLNTACTGRSTKQVSACPPASQPHCMATKPLLYIKGHDMTTRR